MNGKTSPKKVSSAPFYPEKLTQPQTLQFLRVQTKTLRNGSINRKCGEPTLWNTSLPKVSQIQHQRNCHLQKKKKSFVPFESSRHDSFLGDKETTGRDVWGEEETAFWYESTPSRSYLLALECDEKHAPVPSAPMAKFQLISEREEFGSDFIINSCLVLNSPPPPPWPLLHSKANLDSSRNYSRDQTQWSLKINGNISINFKRSWIRLWVSYVISYLKFKIIMVVTSHCEEEKRVKAYTTDSCLLPHFILWDMIDLVKRLHLIFLFHLLSPTFKCQISSHF